ncbi:MAG TPA: FMN-binding protein [Syntrophomonas sp.]|nr:FMN-binding protein [Syntrophomonas sp.]HRW13012.1 FMN-binding protein [Syntrophomonas sp.]
MPIKKLMALMIVILGVWLSGCGEPAEPTEAELAAFNDILSQQYTSKDFKILTQEVMTGERQEKFQAVKKVFTTPAGDYAFVSKPVAYNGPVELAVIIDRESGITAGMKIVRHQETEHYVRDMNNRWFTERFAGKQNDPYLQPVHLDAVHDNEIIIITGATVTTEGITNGVNACLGVYREAELGQTAPAVPYMVKFEKEEGEGPEETGSLAIRAYGVVLGEVSLEQIKAMPSVTRTMSIHSTSGTTSHKFKGTLLANVIAAVDPELLQKYQAVQPVGVDDYMSNITMEEVLAENAVYLMYEDNGQPLLTKPGKQGAMRVVVLDDVFGQRFTNYMIEVVLE